MLLFSRLENLPWGLLGAAAIVLVVALYSLRRVRFMATYPVIRGATNSNVTEFLRNIFLLLAFVSALLVSFEPKRERVVLVPEFEGLDIIAMVDCSKSMLAPAYEHSGESRMAIVTGALEKISRSLDKDRLGVSCFANRLFGTPIPTTDYEHILRPKLFQLNDPAFVSSQGAGTNFAAALEGCRMGFRIDRKVKKICMIFSDGEPQGNAALQAAQLVQNKLLLETDIANEHWNAAFYLIGIGDTRTAFRIPVFGKDGVVEGFEEENGEEILTTPNEIYLRDIATSISNAERPYRHLRASGDISSIIAEIAKEERKLIGLRESRSVADMSRPFILAFMLFLLGFLFSAHTARFFLRVREGRIVP